MEYLSLGDIYSLKFLSKRFYKIIFLNLKIKYFNRISNEIFNANNYYNKLLYSVDMLLKEFKLKFDFPTYLFLKYSFEELINSSLISSCLFDLFSCPRAFFARNTCFNCSRIFVKKDIIKPKNFKSISHFQFSSFFNSGGLLKECQDSIKQFNFIVFFDSYDQYQIIISDRKRCLNSYVFQEHIHFVLAFFEVQLRIFVNFFLQFN